MNKQSWTMLLCIKKHWVNIPLKVDGGYIWRVGLMEDQINTTFFFIFWNLYYDYVILFWKSEKGIFKKNSHTHTCTHSLPKSSQKNGIF